MTNPCGAGGVCAFQSVGHYRDQSGKIGEVTLARCVRCGHGISLPPIPDPTFLYEGRESQDFQPDSRGLAHWIKSIAFRRSAKALLTSIDGGKGKVLDFGCGSAQFSQQLAIAVGAGTVWASDFFDEPPSNLKACHYVPSAALSDHLGTFDAVLALHVLEHDDDTARLLDRITALIRPGGRLVIEVPNIDCVWAKVFGKYWDAWYIPFHRHHFNRASLLALAQASGLERCEIKPVTVPTMGRTLRNIAGIRSELLWLTVGIILHPLQIGLERIVRSPSALRLIARKAHYRPVNPDR